MDSIDRAIISELQRHGRMQNNDLADLVGLSPSPCLRRVRRLEADGVIAGYSAVVDREAVGCAYEPIVWVTLTSVTRESMLEFEQAIQTVPSIIEAARMMGQPDYLLRVVAADAEAFETIYMDELAALPHVQTLTSQLAMKVVKRTTALPIT
jgi:Lrp/AsnC family leucine-responsive transcriptional regulator